MTTLAYATPRTQVMGDYDAFPVIASDIIFEGAAVGLVLATGHARPLTSVDRFVGFNAEEDIDNSAGAAAAVNVRVLKRGTVQLAITGAVITDINLPVYAQDDNAFSFIKTSGVFIGFTRQYVSAGVMQVAFDVENFVDPHEGLTAETVAVAKTLDNADTGKVFFVTADAVVVTLPAVAAMSFRVVNGGAFGTVGFDVAPNASDLVIYKDSAGTDNHGLDNTKATACRGDYLDLSNGDATGWIVPRSRGTWADKDNT